MALFDQKRNEVSNKEPALYSTAIRIGDLRDAFIVCTGVVYVLGYVAWSISSYFLNIGILPAIDAQYFMAGVIPSTLLLVIYAFFCKKDYIDRFLSSTLQSNEHRRANIRKYVWPIYILIMLSLIVLIGLHTIYYDLELIPDNYKYDGSIQGILIALIQSYDYIVKELKFLAISFLFLITLPLILSTYLYPNSISMLRFSRINTFSLLIGWYGIASAVFYIISIGSIPQEFGGMKERCAFLDLHVEKLSNQSLLNMIPLHNDAVEMFNNDKDRIIRSRFVKIVFKTSDVLFVRFDGSENVMEISRDAVSLIDHCAN